MSVALGFSIEQFLGSSHPRGRDRRFASIGVQLDKLEPEGTGPDRVTRRLVSLEGALLRLDRQVALPGKPGCFGHRFQVGRGQLL